MDGCGVILLFLGVLLVIAFVEHASKQADKTPEQRLQEAQGDINPEMVCPHCQKKGGIRTKAVTKKAGVSGGKATAAVLTGGVSLLATGLSR